MSKDLKIFTNNIEQEAVDQINLLLDQEAFKGGGLNGIFKRNKRND